MCVCVCVCAGKGICYRVGVRPLRDCFIPQSMGGCKGCMDGNCRGQLTLLPLAAVALLRASPPASHMVE